MKAAVVQLSSASTSVSSVNTSLYQTQNMIYGFSEGSQKIIFFNIKNHLIIKRCRY